MKFTYIAVCSLDGNPGITKKINDWTDAAFELGLEANSVIISPTGGLKSYFKFNLEIINSKNKILFLRNPTHLRFLLFFSIFIARINKCKIYIDVPSPIYVLVKEVLGRRENIPIKYLTALELIISSSIPFIFANKIIQYANENWWYQIGCRHKTVVVGNGINVTRIKNREGYPNWPSTKLVLIGVANVAIWHGYDRILLAISKINKTIDLNYKVYFHIVGDGPDLSNLKKLVIIYDIEQYVTFHGMLSDPNQIQTIYENSHIAVSSLGLFRIGLDMASVLKSREYVAIGIPFIYAGEDIDFKQPNNFRFMVSNTENINDIVELLQYFNNVIFPKPIEIRNFAINNLSVVTKLKQILEI